MLSGLKDPEAPPAARETPGQPGLRGLRDCSVFPGCRENPGLRVLCLTSSLTLTGSSCRRERTKVPTPSDICRLRWAPWAPEVPQVGRTENNCEPEVSQLADIQVNLAARVLRAGWGRRESTETEDREVPRVLTVREETAAGRVVMESPEWTAVTERRDQTDLPGPGVCREYRGCLEPGDTGAGTV